MSLYNGRKNGQGYPRGGKAPAPAGNGATGVVVLGHGSRAPEAGVLLGWIAGRLAARFDCPVLPASLQFNRPTLEESCRRLYEDGARHIVVAPYFLFEGIHYRRDIPTELERLQVELSGARIEMAASLGADERLVDIILRRILDTDACRGPISAGGFAELPESGLPQHPIEAESFGIIDEILGPQEAASAEYQVTRRVVHATGDVSLAEELSFSRGAIVAARRALAAGGRIICDVNMVAAGVAPTAARLGIDVVCEVASEETAELAHNEGITRGAAGTRRAAERYGLAGAVAAIGNAPTALFELLRLTEETGAGPALVVGVPVGFVGAAESKRALAESGLPHITLPGHRGGSNIAVAITNALLRLAAAGAQTVNTATSDTQSDSGPEGPPGQTRFQGGPHAHS